MNRKFKQRLFSILEESNPDDPISQVDDIFFSILIPLESIKTLFRAIKSQSEELLVTFAIFQADANAI